MPLETYPSILLTGANGWLGRRIVRGLVSGNAEWGAVGRGGIKPHCLVLPQEDKKALRDLGTDIVEGSLSDQESLKRFLNGNEGALLIHVAGLIHPSLFTRDFTRINVEGTRALVDAAAGAGIRRTIVMSSNSPFGGNTTPGGVFDENSPYHPYMGYGRSKWRMEQLLKAHKNWPKTTVIRAPWFYGPGQPPRQTLFFEMIRDGKFPLLGQGLNRRSMAYVDSLAYGMLLAAANEKAAGQIYWLADLKPYPMREVIDTVRAVLRDDFGIKVKEKTVQLPSVVGDIARAVDCGLQSIGLYNQKFHVLSEMNMTIACSIAKAQAELGYKPLVELREGMRRSVAWCLEQNMLARDA